MGGVVAVKVVKRGRKKCRPCFQNEIRDCDFPVFFQFFVMFWDPIFLSQKVSQKWTISIISLDWKPKL